MKHHLNTLFVTTQGAYLSKDGDAVAVRIERETKFRVPLHMLGGICCFGRVSMSPQLMGRCAELGVAVSYLTEHGRLLARVTGFTPGNVLLRREQYRRAELAEDDCNANKPSATAAIIRPIIVAKLLNSRAVLRRAVRDYADSPGVAALEQAAVKLAQSAQQARRGDNAEVLRGIEGEAASLYFSVFSHLVTPAGNSVGVGDEADPGRPETAVAPAAAALTVWTFQGRSRRPRRDNVNALLSFLYAMLAHDARSACEAAGLDSQVGFLHRDRPGRPSLALDLMEELRAFLCDRLALSLINRRQVRPEGFTRTEAGGILMDDTTRKTVLAAYQKRKQEELVHPFLNEKVSVGLLVHLQARLLARHLRGDLDIYPPFIWK